MSERLRSLERALAALWARPGTWGVGLALIAAFGLALRLHAAAARPQLSHEERVHVAIAAPLLEPGGRRVSHAGDHPALGAYIIAASGRVFGRDPLGYRMASVLAGTLAIALTGWAVAQSASRAEALLAALLLAINGFHVGLSSRAAAGAYHQPVFVTAAWCCLATLPGGGGPALVGAAALLGLGFLCSESAALVGAGWALALLLAPRLRQALTRRHALLALGVFLAVVAPDVVYNFGAHAPERSYVNYLDHLERVARPTLSLAGLSVFLRDAFNLLIVGRLDLWADLRCEYLGPGIVLGALLLAGFLASFREGGDPSGGLWRTPILLFVLLLTFLGPAPYAVELDPPNWTWSAPVVGLASACAARLVVRHWRLAWPIVPLLLYLLTQPDPALVRPCV